MNLTRSLRFQKTHSVTSHLPPLWPQADQGCSPLGPLTCGLSYCLYYQGCCSQQSPQASQATQGSNQALCPQLGTASESLPCLAICCSPSSLLSEADRGLAPLRAPRFYLPLVFVFSPGAGAKASACVSLQQTQDSEVAEIKLRSQGTLNPRTILASYSQDQNNPGFL